MGVDGEVIVGRTIVLVGRGVLVGVNVTSIPPTVGNAVIVIGSGGNVGTGPGAIMYAKIPKQ
jgi:hypothetical protein